MIAAFRRREASHVGNSGENDPEHGSFQLLGVLGFRHIGSHIDFPPSNTFDKTQGTVYQFTVLDRTVSTPGTEAHRTRAFCGLRLRAVFLAPRHHRFAHDGAVETLRGPKR